MIKLFFILLIFLPAFLNAQPSRSIVEDDTPYNKSRVTDKALFRDSVNNLFVDAGGDTTYCVGMDPKVMFLGNNLIIDNGVEPYSVRWECKLELTPTLVFTASDFLDDTTKHTPVIKEIINWPQWLKFTVHITDSENNYVKDSINVRFSTFAYLTGYNVIEVEKGDSVLFNQSSVGGGINPLTFHWQPTIGLTNPDTLVTWCKTDSLTQWRNEYDVIATDSCGCISAPNLAYEVRVLTTGINDKVIEKNVFNIRQIDTRVFFNNSFKQRAQITLFSLNGTVFSTFETTNDNFEITPILKNKGLYIVRISIGEIFDSKKYINF